MGKFGVSKIELVSLPCNCGIDHEPGYTVVIHTPEAMSKDQRFALTEYLIGMLGRGLEFMDETEDGTPNTRAILLINPDYATIETWKDRQHAQHLLFAQAVASALELPPGSIPERVLVLPD